LGRGPQEKGCRRKFLGGATLAQHGLVLAKKGGGVRALSCAREKRRGQVVHWIPRVDELFCHGGKAGDENAKKKLSRAAEYLNCTAGRQAWGAHIPSQGEKKHCPGRKEKNFFKEKVVRVVLKREESPGCVRESLTCRRRSSGYGGKGGEEKKGPGSIRKRDHLHLREAL